MKHLHGKGSRRVRTFASTLTVKITSGTTKVELRAFHQNTERPFADSVQDRQKYQKEPKEREQQNCVHFTKIQRDPLQTVFRIVRSTRKNPRRENSRTVCISPKYRETSADSVQDRQKYQEEPKEREQQKCVHFTKIQRDPLQTVFRIVRITSKNPRKENSRTAYISPNTERASAGKVFRIVRSTRKNPRKENSRSVCISPNTERPSADCVQDRQKYQQEPKEREQQNCVHFT